MGGALRCSTCTGLSFSFPTFVQKLGQPEAPGPSAHPNIATQQAAFLWQRSRTQGQGRPLSTSQEVWDRCWHVYEVVQRGSEKRRWGHGKSMGSFRGGLGEKVGTRDLQSYKSHSGPFFRVRRPLSP